MEWTISKPLWPVFYITNRKIDDNAAVRHHITELYTTRQSLASQEHHWFRLGVLGCNMDERFSHHVRGTGIGDRAFESYLELERDDFIQELKYSLRQHSEIVMFVHGFNVTWGSAIKTAAQLTWDTAPGPSAPDMLPKRMALVFDWASLGKLLAYAGVPYENDKARIDEAQEMLPQLLEMLCDLARDDVERRWKALHIVAHSMGNLVLQRGLANALRLSQEDAEALRARRGAHGAAAGGIAGEEVAPAFKGPRPRSGYDMLRELDGMGIKLTMTFAAPDIDRASMNSMLNNLSWLCPCTLYCSRHDVPLGFATAAAVLRGYDLRGRAGYYSWGPFHREHAYHIFSHDVVETVKVSGIRGDFTGHSYFCRSHLLLDDISAVMAFKPREDRPAHRLFSKCRTCAARYLFQLKA